MSTCYKKLQERQLFTPFRAPFTLQRLCEILLLPPVNKQIRSREALLFALDSVLSVKSTIKPVEQEQYNSLVQKNQRLMARVKAKPKSEDKQLKKKRAQPAKPQGEFIMAVVCYVGFFVCTALMWQFIATDRR